MTHLSVCLTDIDVLSSDQLTGLKACNVIARAEGPGKTPHKYSPAL